MNLIDVAEMIDRIVAVLVRALTGARRRARQ
jgi:hypothetical protein